MPIEAKGTAGNRTVKLRGIGAPLSTSSAKYMDTYHEESTPVDPGGRRRDAMVVVLLVVTAVCHTGEGGEEGERREFGNVDAVDTKSYGVVVGER